MKTPDITAQQITQDNTTPAKASTQANSSTDREKILDEISFDKRVYGGISYFAQAATGVALSYWTKHSGGQQFFKNITEYIGPKIYKNLAATKGVPAAAAAVTTITVASIMIGVGTSFLIPVKMLEKNKAKIVRKMYESRIAKEEANGYVLTPEQKARDEELLQQLEKEPLQTWGSLLEARAGSLVGVYAVLFALGEKNNQIMQNTTTKGILKSLETAGLKKAAQSKPLSNLFDIAFVDAFYSMVSAGGLYVYSHYIHPPKKHHKNDISDETQQALSTATTVTEALTAEEETPTKSFQDRIRPRDKIVVPEALHTQKLATEADPSFASPAM